MHKPTTVDLTIITPTGYGTEKTCSTCLAWDPVTHLCHRHPPPDFTYGQRLWIAHRVTTLPTEWCIDWVPRT